VQAETPVVEVNDAASERADNRSSVEAGAFSERRLEAAEAEPS